MPVDLRHWKECNSHPHSLKSTLWYSTNMTKCVLTIQLHIQMVTARESSIGLAMSWQERFAALGAAVKLLLLKEESHKRKMVVGFHLEAIN